MKINDTLPGVAMAALALMVAFAAPVAKAAATDDPVVARLGGAEIKESEVRQMLDRLDPQARKQATASSRSLLNFVRAELGRRAVLDEAKRKKWDQQPDIAARIEQAKSDLIVSSYLASVSAPPSTTVGDDQIRSLYDANLSRFMLPRRYHLAQIYVAVPDAATPAERDAAKARAQDLAKKAHDKGADFAALAHAGSDDKASADKGGDLGWLPDTDLVPAIASVAQGLSENETSGPIEAKDGWHIVRELGTRPAGPAPLDDVKPALVNSIRQQAAQRSAELYLEKLLTEQKAAVNEIELTRLVDGSGG
jgi:peptidylprolyl isomerase